MKKGNGESESSVDNDNKTSGAKKVFACDQAKFDTGDVTQVANVAKHVEKFVLNIREFTQHVDNRQILADAPEKEAPDEPTEPQVSESKCKVAVDPVKDQVQCDVQLRLIMAQHEMDPTEHKKRVADLSWALQDLPQLKGSDRQEFKIVHGSRFCNCWDWG